MEDIQTPSAPACASCNSTSVVEGFSTPLCQPCRDALIKYPIPLGIKLFAGGILAIMLVSLVAFPKRFTLGLHIEKGRKAMEEHKYLTAKREFTPVAAAYPDNTEWQANLMLSAFYNGDLSTFASIGEKIANQPIEDSRLLKNLTFAANHFNEYYPSDSLQASLTGYMDTRAPDAVYTNYLQKDPENIYALIMYASSLYDQDRMTESDSIVKLVLAKNELYQPGLRLAVSIQRELGNFQEAHRYCDQILRINREIAFAIASKARVFLKQHKDKEALQTALEAVAVDKDDAYSSATLALAYHFNQQTKQRDAVIKELQQDSTASNVLQYALDVIHNKETFRN